MRLADTHRKELAGILALIWFTFIICSLFSGIPDEMKVAGQIQEVRLQVPVTLSKMENASTMETGNIIPYSQQETGNIISDPQQESVERTYLCKLFGVIPVKTIQVISTARQEVYAVGMPCGIYMKMKGVLVEGLKEVETESGLTDTPAKGIIQPGDYISQVNGVSISSKEEMAQLVKESAGGKMTLGIIRQEESFQVAVTPVQNTQGMYQLGIWIKDDLSGVGTLTYYRKDGSFGALGHGVSDSATGSLLTMEHGYIYPSDITSIEKGATGSPGEITGFIQYGKESLMGEIKKNTPAGIYGAFLPFAWDEIQGMQYDLAYKQEIEKKEAVILFQVQDQVKPYSIQIDAIDYEPKEKNKSFRFHVTDKALLEETGGIVQGMSGAPHYSE